jgi:hypothetical protein
VSFSHVTCVVVSVHVLPAAVHGPFRQVHA